MPRRSVKHTMSLTERLKLFASKYRDEAKSKKSSDESIMLLQKAEQFEAAVHMENWLTSGDPSRNDGKNDEVFGEEGLNQDTTAPHAARDS